MRDIFPKDSVLAVQTPEVFYKVCAQFLNAFYMKSMLEKCNVSITSNDQETSPGIKHQKLAYSLAYREI